MRLRRIAALGVVALVTAALPALAMPSQAATPVPTPTSPFTYTAAIEDPAAYDGQTICSPAPKPGTLKLRSLLLTTYGPASADISRPCSQGGQSEHKEGRAIDWMLSYNVPAERVKVQAFLAWLLAPDKFGNKAAMARRLGVMYMGWDNMFWRSYGQMGWGDLKGCSTDPALKASSYDTFCHRNHLHISLSWDGASGLTSYWTGWVIPPPCAAPYGSASTRAGAGATFVPVTPARILDTRLGTGLAGPCRATVPATWDTTGHDVVLKAVGVGGVPATGVASVALRVTATRPSALPLTVLSRSTAGSPSVAALSLTGGGSPSSTTLVPVASDGTIRLWVDRGSADLRADVLGYVPLASGSTPPVAGLGAAHPLGPRWVYDGRTVPLAPKEVRVLHLAGAGPIPSTGVSALSLTVATLPSATSDAVSVLSSEHGYVVGLTLSSTASVRWTQVLLPTSGDVVITNSGTSPVAFRVMATGWWGTSATAAGGTFTSLATPAVIASSSRGIGLPGPVTSAAPRYFAVTGAAVPKGATAVLLSVTVAGGATVGTLSFGPMGTAGWASAFSFGARNMVTETVLAPLGSDGRLGVATASLGTAIRVTVLGYVA